MIWGARASLLIGVASVLLGLVLGGLLGLVAGYFRGAPTPCSPAAFDILLSFPQLVLALTLVDRVRQRRGGQLAPAAWSVLILALGHRVDPAPRPHHPGQHAGWSQREFVWPPGPSGPGNRQIMFREVLPNVLPAMFSIALLGVAVAIVAEGGLSLLGVGMQLPTPSWGNIIAEGRTELRDAPHIVIVPTIVIFLTVLALNYLGDVVRARFDVRESAL